MATNFVYDGDVVPVLESLLTHPTHSPDYVESGDPVLVGSLTGVALTSAAAATDTVSIAVEGVWDLPVVATTAAADSAVAVGDKLYMAAADVKAQATITSDTTSPSDGDTVTIGSTVYTFKTALTTDPAAVPYEVLIGVSAAVALDNLKSAINGTAGEGTTYGTGTVAHPTFEATDNANTTQKILARTAGATYNSTATTETSSHLAWGASTAFGGLLKGDLSKTSGDTYFGIAVEAIGTAGARDTINVRLKETLS